MISLRQLEEFFGSTRQTRDSGLCSWDIDGLCRWSYFFVDIDRSKLLPVAEHMELEGFEVVGILDPDDRDESSEHYLRIDRLERHTPVTLHALNQSLYRIADRFGVDYDGMDVGAVEGP